MSRTFDGLSVAMSTLAWTLCLACGESRSTPAPNGDAGPGGEAGQAVGSGGNASGGDGSAGADGGAAADGGGDIDGGAGPSACIAPYPEQRSACTGPSEVCIPPEGFTCCRCLLGHDCGAPYVWSCQNSFPDCPELAPTEGGSCTLPDSTSCVYCTTQAVQFTCRDGLWARVLDELYCTP